MFMSLIHTTWVKQSVSSGACNLDWKNLTDCVVMDMFKRPDNPYTVISSRIINLVQTPHSSRLSVYLPILCLALLIMICNGIILVTIQSLLDGQNKSQVLKLIASLTLADFIIGVFTFYGSASLIANGLLRNANEPSTVTDCLVVNSFIFICCFSLQMHLVVMAGDRYYCVIKKNGYQLYWTNKNVYITIGAIWISAIFLGFLPALGWRENFNYCFFSYLYNRGYFYVLSILTFLSLCGVTAIFITIFYCARNNTSNSLDEIVPQYLESRIKFNRRLVTTVLLYVASLFATWPPALFYLAATCNSCLAPSDSDVTLFGMFGLVLLGSAIRPIIYAVRIAGIANVFKSLVSKFVAVPENRRELATVAGGREEPASINRPDILNSHRQRITTVIPVLYDQRVDRYQVQDAGRCKFNADDGMLY